MLKSLRRKASDRKLRLFVVACSHLDYEKPPSVIPKFEAVERFADGRATLKEITKLWLQRGSLNEFAWPERPFEWATGFVNWCCTYEEEDQKGYPPAILLPPILRDIFGNPFQPPPRIDPAWLARNDGTVRKLAEAIYEGRSFDRLPILADALEEAGCEDAELLGHLRGSGPHAKGCWALDLVLGKR
jgi:hypothetical protein